MIEIMVAISVILILMAMAVIGYRYLDRSASEKATHVALSNAQAMISEYEAANGPGSINDITGANTTTVMTRLVAIPKNKDAIANLPTKMVKAGSNPPVLLDGWGNPIVYVPKTGLTSGGKTITHPEGRPFWASPGPDGDINTPDDNIYSFEK